MTCAHKRLIGAQALVPVYVIPTREVVLYVVPLCGESGAKPKANLKILKHSIFFW